MRWCFPMCVLLAACGLLCGQPGGGGVAHVTSQAFARDGTAAHAWLPADLHMKNVGGSDGKGLCVFTSAEMVARATNIRQLRGFQKWMTRRPGGGWPEKLDRMIDQYCREQAVPKPLYFHVESNDLNLLRKALRSGRPVGITYSHSPTGRYGGSRIAHMVMCCAAGAGKGVDGKGWYCVNDNNMPGTWEWMSEDQLLRVAAGGGRMWFVVFANPTYPPGPSL